MTRALSADPFAALSAIESDKASSTGVVGEGPVPVIPVPPDVPSATFHHSTLGDPTATWCYRDAAGRLLGHIARFDRPGGKEFLPRTWCRLRDGSHGWCWRSLAYPRPLYGLERLAARPQATVLVVEGEKTADAAIEHFPHLVVVTWPTGTNSVDRVDWRPLAGRRVIVWPDADAAGRKAAIEVAKLASKTGVVSVAVVPVPDSLRQGWDLADAIPNGIDINRLLRDADPVENETEMPGGYTMTDDGLVWRDTEGQKPDLLLTGRFEVLAETRDGVNAGAKMHRPWTAPLKVDRFEGC